MVEQLISSEGGFSETLAFAPGPLLPFHCPLRRLPHRAHPTTDVSFERVKPCPLTVYADQVDADIVIHIDWRGAFHASHPTYLQRAS